MSGEEKIWHLEEGSLPDIKAEIIIPGQVVGIKTEYDSEVTNPDVKADIIPSSIETEYDLEVTNPDVKTEIAEAVRIKTEYGEDDTS